MVDSKTKDTPISYQLDRVVGVCHNQVVSLFDKIVDKDVKIPTDKKFPDVQETLRVTWFNSITGDEPPEPFLK